MSRRLFTLIVAFSMILTSAGAVLAVDAYVVGMSAALTGQGSGSYAPIKDAFDIYFKALNAKGGINGHPVKIIFSDNAAQPSKAAADAKRFATQDKVILLMNASLSSTYAPMIQVAKRYKIPIFFAGGVCPSDVYPPKPAPLEFCATGFGFRYDSQFAIPFIKETAKGQAGTGGHEHPGFPGRNGIRGNAGQEGQGLHGHRNRGHTAANP